MFERKRLTRRVMLMGLAASALLWIAIAFQYSTINADVRKLQVKCESEAASDCDPEFIDPDLHLPLTDTQTQLATAWRQEEKVEDRFLLAALPLLLLSIPRVWYFVLDRIREVSDAVRGEG